MSDELLIHKRNPNGTLIGVMFETLTLIAYISLGTLLGRLTSFSFTHTVLSGNCVRFSNVIKLSLRLLLGFKGEFLV